MKWTCPGCTLTKRPGLDACPNCCGWKKEKVPSGFFVCELCRQEGEDVRMPNDPIGAALMQAHLGDKHDVTLLTEWGVG